MERILNDLEDELTALRQEEVVASSDRKEEMKQLEAYRSHSNFMKEKVGGVAVHAGKVDMSGISIKICVHLRYFVRGEDTLR